MANLQHELENCRANLLKAITWKDEALIRLWSKVERSIKERIAERMGNSSIATAEKIFKNGGESLKNSAGDKI